MRFPASIGAKAFVLVFPLSIFAANAQQNTATLSDGGGVDFTGRAKATRTVDHSHPVPDGAEIAVSNRFGKIRLSGWDSRVLRVSAAWPSPSSNTATIACQRCCDLKMAAAFS